MQDYIGAMPPLILQLLRLYEALREWSGSPPSPTLRYELQWVTFCFPCPHSHVLSAARKAHT